jgi:hypothetical protein
MERSNSVHGGMAAASTPPWRLAPGFVASVFGGQPARFPAGDHGAPHGSFATKTPAMPLWRSGYGPDPRAMLS